MDTDRYENAFGSLIKQARTQHQWTRQMLARKSHLPPACIAAYEEKAHIPRERDIVEVLADVLKRDPDTLLHAWSHPSRTTDQHSGKKQRRSASLKECQSPSDRQTHGIRCREEAGPIREGWTHVVADGVWQGEHAMLLDPPRTAFRPLPDDHPHPVWCQFEHLPAQWFPSARLTPLQR